MENYLIGFIGFNREQTINNFKSFVLANKDSIVKRSYKNYYCEFKDGTTVKCVFKAQINKDKFDQIIISDDSRMLAGLYLEDYQFEFSNRVPIELRFIQDIVD